jgi:hypothetical protein
MSSEPDASVLRRSIDQPDCFALLFDRHFAEVHPYLRRRLGDELAAELAAETFLRAFHSRRRFPGDEESAGKRRSGKTGKGNKWLRSTLTEAASAASRTKDSYLHAQYQRLRGRCGHSKAVTAVGHSILTAAWHMLQTGELYNDPGSDYFTRQHPDRITRRLVRQLETLGHTVTIEPREVAA